MSSLASAAVVRTGAGVGAVAKAKPLGVKTEFGGKGKEIVGSGEGKKKVNDGSVRQQVTSVVQKSASLTSKQQGKPEISSLKTVSGSTKTTTSVKKRAEKKVFTLPGQRYDPPEEREPLRIFYESLSNQIPSSEMAEFWMMEHGLLSPERAKKAYERKQKRQQQLRTGTPIKSIKQERPESSQKSQMSKIGDVKAKKRMNYSDEDDDFDVKPKNLKV